jgi:hypothetical protein
MPVRTVRSPMLLGVVCCVVRSPMFLGMLHSLVSVPSNAMCVLLGVVHSLVVCCVSVPGMTASRVPVCCGVLAVSRMPVCRGVLMTSRMPVCRGVLAVSRMPVCRGVLAVSRMPVCHGVLMTSRMSSSNVARFDFVAAGVLDGRPLKRGVFRVLGCETHTQSGM